MDQPEQQTNVAINTLANLRAALQGIEESLTDAEKVQWTGVKDDL